MCEIVLGLKCGLPKWYETFICLFSSFFFSIIFDFTSVETLKCVLSKSLRNVTMYYKWKCHNLSKETDKLFQIEHKNADKYRLVFELNNSNLMKNAWHLVHHFRQSVQLHCETIFQSIKHLLLERTQYPSIAALPCHQF